MSAKSLARILVVLVILTFVFIPFQNNVMAMPPQQPVNNTLDVIALIFPNNTPMYNLELKFYLVLFRNNQVYNDIIDYGFCTTDTSGKCTVSLYAPPAEMSDNDYYAIYVWSEIYDGFFADWQFYTYDTQPFTYKVDALDTPAYNPNASGTEQRYLPAKRIIEPYIENTPMPDKYPILTAPVISTPVGSFDDDDVAVTNSETSSQFSWVLVVLFSLLLAIPAGYFLLKKSK